MERKGSDSGGLVIIETIVACPEYIMFSNMSSKHILQDDETLDDMLMFLCCFYPRPVLAFGYCRCLRLSVCVSVCVYPSTLSLSAP